MDQSSFIMNQSTEHLLHRKALPTIPANSNFHYTSYPQGSRTSMSKPLPPPPRRYAPLSSHGLPKAPSGRNSSARPGIHRFDQPCAPVCVSEMTLQQPQKLGRRGGRRFRAWEEDEESQTLRGGEGSEGVGRGGVRRRESVFVRLGRLGGRLRAELLKSAPEKAYRRYEKWAENEDVERVESVHWTEQ